MHLCSDYVNFGLCRVPAINGDVYRVFAQISALFPCRMERGARLHQLLQLPGASAAISFLITAEEKTLSIPPPTFAPGPPLENAGSFAGWFFSPHSGTSPGYTRLSVGCSAGKMPSFCCLRKTAESC